MRDNNNPSTSTILPPDEAFSVLGNQTRMEILQQLSTADSPLVFSDLYDRVEITDSGQFNYHLDKLIDHFVRTTEDGYELQQAGRRVIEAVLSGAVTEAPEINWTPIEESCHLCGGSIAVQYREERMSVCCTECSGTYPSSFGARPREIPAEYGYLGDLMMPPAGIKDRTPIEAFQAAWRWSNLELLGMGSGICPRCSATIEHSLSVCENHNSGDGRCPNCDRRQAVNFAADCINCHYGHHGGVALGLGTEMAILSLLINNGINPVAPGSAGRETMDQIRQDYTEEIVETDPLKITFTFTVQEEELSMTVDEELTVLDVHRTGTPGKESVQ